MNFSTWAIRNPVPPITLFLVLVITSYSIHYTKLYERPMAMRLERLNRPTISQMS